MSILDVPFKEARMGIVGDKLKKILANALTHQAKNKGDTTELHATCVSLSETAYLRLCHQVIKGVMPQAFVRYVPMGRDTTLLVVLDVNSIPVARIKCNILKGSGIKAITFHPNITIPLERQTQRWNLMFYDDIPD